MASAASRISAHAAVYKPQAQTADPAAGAGGADDVSPFSILLNQVTAAKPSQQDTKDPQNGRSDTNASGAAPDGADGSSDTANSGTAAGPAGDDAAAPPQLTSILLGQTDGADIGRTPDAGKTDAPGAKTKAKSPGDDASKDVTATAPADSMAQLVLFAPPPAPLPATAPSAPAAGDDDTDIEVTAPAAMSAKAGPSGQDGAPLASAPQTDVPQTEFPQIGAPPANLSPAGASTPAQKTAAANAATADTQAQPGDEADADAPVTDAAAVPAVNATAPKMPVKAATALQGQNNAKPARPDAGGGDSSRAQQADPLPQPRAPQPPVQAKAEAPNLNGSIQPAAGPAAGTPAPVSHVHVASQDATTPDMTLLAVQIAAKSQSGSRQFDIRLDPPELGRVDVRLSIDASGKAQAHLSADQQSTLDMLQKDAPVLTRALRDAGLDVSQGGLNFSLRGQGGNNGGNGADAGGNGAQNGRRNFTVPVAALGNIDFVAATWRGPADGRLDIRV